MNGALHLFVRDTIETQLKAKGPDIEPRAEPELSIYRTKDVESNCTTLNSHVHIVLHILFLDLPCHIKLPWDFPCCMNHRAVACTPSVVESIYSICSQFVLPSPRCTETH